MKKLLSLAIALAVALSLAACGGQSGGTAGAGDSGGGPDGGADSAGYTIQIYSNSNSPECTAWLVSRAADAGFTVSMTDNSIISGDLATVQAANRNGDGDLIFGLNETRWGQIISGQYEKLSLIDWTPSWAAEVGEYAYAGKAYGIVIQNVLMLYRNDELGTNGEALHFAHWADVTDSGYKWYRQNKLGGTTNANINSAMLYAFTDPSSPAGGVSVDGWKALWKFCAQGVSGGDDYNYGFEPLNRGDVAVSEFFSSALYGRINEAAGSSDHPLRGTVNPENWAIVDIDDGTYYIAEYIGVLDKPGRTAEQTETVKAFAEWFGSAETQAAWAEEFGSFPCNTAAAALVYDTIPAIYTIPNFALTTVEGTGMTYAAYVAAHIREWTNIMANLGFYWTDENTPPEPDWDNLDWAALTQNAP